MFKIKQSYYIHYLEIYYNNLLVGSWSKSEKFFYYTLNVSDKKFPKDFKSKLALIVFLL